MPPAFSRLKSLVPPAARDRHRQRWYDLRYAARNALGRVKRLAVRPALPDPALGANLHLGCGPVNHPAFINVDGAYFPHVHYMRRLTDLSPFKDGTIDFLYASHCLEHIDFGDTPATLREWCRVLRPGGVARISVPDFDTLLEAYAAAGNDVAAIEVYLLGGQGNGFNYHVALFNEARLTARLLEAGFREVRRWEAGQDDFARFPDASAMTIPVGGREVPLSLNLEAVK